MVDNFKKMKIDPTYLFEYIPRMISKIQKAQKTTPKTQKRPPKKYQKPKWWIILTK